MSVTALHSNNISGTTTLDDGTKIYWTPYRHSDTIVVVRPDNNRVEMSYLDPDPILLRPEINNFSNYDVRPMTQAEEKEWDTIRRGGN